MFRKAGDMLSNGITAEGGVGWNSHHGREDLFPKLKFKNTKGKGERNNQCTISGYRIINDQEQGGGKKTNLGGDRGVLA